jgi:hypothetical protein
VESADFFCPASPQELQMEIERNKANTNKYLMAEKFIIQAMREICEPFSQSNGSI